ncbi:MAG: isopentenyl phosphate kinase [Candidatus Thorarchaeota archaeon]
MASELTIIKLGGALLTDKSAPYTARKDILTAVAREIKECLDLGLLKSLILLNGVGSFGHPPVLAHQLHKGFLGPEKLLPLSNTFRIVNEFRNMIVTHLQEAAIPVFLIHPSSMAVAEQMRMTRYFLEPVKGYMSVGLIPLLGGDMLYDSAMGWSVGSADQLGVILAQELSATRLIFATDVPGIYEGDPKTHAAVKLMEEINLNELEAALETMGMGTADASGEMKGKLKALIPAKGLIEKGLEISIISMMEYGNLKALLKGDQVPSTRIVVA